MLWGIGAGSMRLQIDDPVSRCATRGGAAFGSSLPGVKISTVLFQAAFVPCPTLCTPLDMACKGEKPGGSAFFSIQALRAGAGRSFGALLNGDFGTSILENGEWVYQGVGSMGVMALDDWGGRDGAMPEEIDFEVKPGE